MTADLLVGLDVGTTMTKAAVVRAEDGHEVAWGRAPTSWRAVPTGAEAAADDFLDAAVHALSEAVDAAPAGPVVGLGVTSMAETVVMLDEDDLPLGPCIAWYDVRGEQEAQDLAAAFGEDVFSDRTGLGASSMCTLVKLAWLSRQGVPPPVRALSIADWVAHKLGAGQLSEASLASRTGALVLEGRQWWDELLEWAGVPVDLFPPVVQAGHRSGQVRGDSTLRRLEGAALTSAGHDHLCGAVGVGAVSDDQLLDSCGTAEAFVRAVAPLGAAGVSRALGAGLSVGWHVLDGHQALMRGQSLGLLLEKIASLVGASTPDAVAALDRAAAAVGPGPLRVCQEGPFGPASVQGLDGRPSPAALWSAALAHVSDGAAASVRAMQDVAGPARELVLGGGWAHCPGVRRGKLHLLPRARWPRVQEAGARGAALFGGVAAGIFAGPSAFPVPEDQPLQLSAPGARHASHLYP